MKTELQKVLMKQSGEKLLHDQYPARLDREGVSLSKIQKHFKSPGLKAETE